MRNLTLFLLFILIAGSSFAQNTAPPLDTLPNNVGDIPFDSTKDDPTFYLCNKEFIPQYYQAKIHYKGEWKTLKKFFFDHLTWSKPSQETGYITIRFIVNCKGETDRFRIFQMGGDYKPYLFDKSLVEELLSLTKKSDGWIPGKYQNKTYDAYMYLSFKIINGKLVSIQP